MSQENNFKKLLLPNQLLYKGFYFWIIIFIVIPVTYIELGEHTSLAILSVFLFSFFLFLGTQMPILITKPKQAYPLSKIRTLIIILIILGVIGDVFRYSQRLNSGINVSSVGIDILQNRIDSLDAGELTGGLQSVIASLLFPFGVMALLLSIYFRTAISQLIFICALLTGIYPILDGIMLGGRSSLLMLISVFVITILIKYALIEKVVQKKIIPKKFLLRGSIFFVLAISFFIYISSQRQFSKDELEVLKYWEEGRHFELNDFAYSIIKNSTSLIYVYMGFLELLHYIAHGMMEYVKLFNHIYTTTDSLWLGTYYGKYQFYVFLKFFKAFGIDIGIDANTMNREAFHASGVFTTFWGPALIDFGLFGCFLYSFLIGMLAKFLYYKAIIQNSIFALLFYPFLATAIFTSFIIHALNDSNLYYLVSAIMTSLLYKLVKMV